MNDNLVCILGNVFQKCACCLDGVLSDEAGDKLLFFILKKTTLNLRRLAFTDVQIEYLQRLHLDLESNSER